MPRAPGSTDLSSAEEQTSSASAASPSAEAPNSAHEEFKVEPHPEENGEQASPQPLPQDTPTLLAPPTLQEIDSPSPEQPQAPPKAEPEAFRRELPKVKLPKANLPVADPVAPNLAPITPAEGPAPVDQPSSSGRFVSKSLSIDEDVPPEPSTAKPGSAFPAGPLPQADKPAPGGRFASKSLPLDIDVKPEAVPTPVASAVPPTPKAAPLPKPPAAYAMPLPSPKRRFRPRGQFTPAFRAGMLRLTVLVCILVGLIGVGCYKHWFPWLDALHLTAPKKAAMASSAVPAVASKPGATATAVPAPGGQPTTPAPGATSAGGAQPDQTAKAPAGGEAAASETVAPAPPSAALPNAAASENKTGRDSSSSVLPESEGASDSPPSAAPVAPPATKAKPAPTVSATKHSSAHSSPAHSPNPTPSPAQQGTVVPPRLIKSVPAVASLDDLRDFERGDVVIDALIDESGQVKSMNVLSGPPSLRPRAMDALKNYKYVPATLNGKPIPAHVTVNIQFRYAQE